MRRAEVGGRMVLAGLVLIHLTLPFTPLNPHPQLRIRVASLILALLFGLLTWRSRSAPRAAFAIGVVLLMGVYAVSASTGASPLTEGWLVKLVFAAVLLWATIQADRASAPHGLPSRATE